MMALIYRVQSGAISSLLPLLTRKIVSRIFVSLLEGCKRPDPFGDESYVVYQRAGNSRLTLLLHRSCNDTKTDLLSY